MKTPKTVYRIGVLSILLCTVILMLLIFNGDLPGTVLAMNQDPLRRLDDVASGEVIQADFSASPRYGQSPLSVTFANHTSGDFDTLLWDFGDGSTYSFWDPTHTYTASGVYTVTLTASNATSQDTVSKESYICVDTLCADSDLLSYVNHFGGNVTAVAVRDHYAYIGQGHWLTIVDVSDPLSPYIVSSSDLLPDEVEDIVLNGDYAYLANGYDGGLRIIDISDPRHPTEVGSFQTHLTVRGVQVVDSTAYIVDSEGLHILDVSDPTSPVELGSYLTGWRTYNVDVVGTTVFMVDKANYLRIVDATDPANPFEITYVAGGGEPRDVDVVGDYAYVASKTLRIYDVKDPSHPLQIASVAGNPAAAITFSDNKVYLALGSFGFRVYDVSNPFHPTDLGYYDDIYAGDVAVWGDIAYVAAHSDGLTLLDVGDLRRPSQLDLWDTSERGNAGLSALDVDKLVQPRELSTLATQSDIQDVDVVGEYAYMVKLTGMYIVDIHIPSQLEQVSFLELPHGNVAIKVQDGIAYIANRSSGLHFIDVNEPTKPFEIGVSEIPSYAHNLDLVGDVAYVAAGWEGLYILDVSDPSHPSEIGRYEPATLVYDVDVSGDVAYLAEEGGGNDEYGLRMVDISNPANPIELGVYPSRWGVVDIAVVGETAYSVFDFAGFGVIDVTDPVKPTQIRFFETLAGAIRVATEGDFAYVLVEDEYDPNSVRLINISSPSNPYESTFLRIPTGVNGLRVKGDLIYIASGYDGLVILSHDSSRVNYLPLFLKP
ncbi:MAG TPA: PKD domain-containing protein [Caldilineae bacterium]|nr:PKD domain-containing protein [Caldilineae bacterium]